MRADRGHEMPHEIVRQRALFCDLAHEHRDRATDRLVDINNKHLVVIPEKNSASSASGQDRPHLHLNHRFIHPEKRYARRYEKQASDPDNAREKFFRPVLACRPR